MSAIGSKIERPFVRPCWVNNRRLGVWSQWGHDKDGYLRCFSVDFEPRPIQQPSKGLPYASGRIKSGWRPYEDCWIWASKRLPKAERLAAYQDIATLSGRSVGAIMSRSYKIGPEPAWAFPAALDIWKKR